MASSAAFEFPAYRSSEWMRLPLCPPALVLQHANLHPKHMQYFPNNALYEAKAATVREQIRTALFRQALYKVQNVEVLTTDCPENSRLLLSVQSQPPSPASFWWTQSSESRALIRDELWHIQRCAHLPPVHYQVRYYAEGDGDGFSVEVEPRSWADRLRAFRFAYL